jgi:hypothetical protein
VADLESSGVSDQESQFSMEKRRASERLNEAMNDAMEDGIAPDAVAHAALFHSCTLLVEIYGEEAVAGMLAKMQASVKEGAYTLPDIVH